MGNVPSVAMGPIYLVQSDSRIFWSCSGQGSHEDIVVASARAYTHALNKMIGWMGSHNVNAVLNNAEMAKGGKVAVGNSV